MFTLHALLLSYNLLLRSDFYIHIFNVAGQLTHFLHILRQTTKDKAPGMHEIEATTKGITYGVATQLRWLIVGFTV